MSQNKQTFLRKCFFVFLMIILWEIVSLCMNNRIVIASPFDTEKAFGEIVKDFNLFADIVFRSFLLILLGFLVGVILAIIFIILSENYSWVYDFCAPFLHFCKSVPVACFVVFFLMLVGSDMLSLFISIIITLPIVYAQGYAGLKGVSGNLYDFITVYKIRGYRKWMYVLFPAIWDTFLSSMLLAFSMSFKAGIAAELIGAPKNTIGEQLYYAKIYLETGSLFAWTIIIMLLSFFASVAFKKIMTFSFYKLSKRTKE